MIIIGWRKMMDDIFSYLDELYPDAHCELEYNKDYELLIAIVLSAQTTDKRVNKVTKVLFSKYTNLIDLSKASVFDIENIIREIGTYKKKSEFVKKIAVKLVTDGYDYVPNNYEYLLSLPGVGRKTVNVFLSEIYNVPAIAVDTHVERVSKRLGFAKDNDNVLTVENKLMKKIPKDRWIKTHHQFIFFGRYFCKSLSPKCFECSLKSICKYYVKSNKNIKKHSNDGFTNLSNEFIIHEISNNVQYIQFKKLLEYSDIITHAYTLKMDNVSFVTLNDIEMKNSINNYKKLCDVLKLDYVNIVKCSQTHTDNVLSVNRKINKNIPDINNLEYSDVDGLITNKKNLILSTTNADCILFLLFDPVNRVIANVHSGWRGTLKEIVIKAVMKMHNEYNSSYKDIICCMSPSIRVCHFEVDKDVRNLFYEKFSYLNNINKIIISGNSAHKYYIDTVLLNRTLLLNLGLCDDNIVDSSICSVCNSDNINSYRVDGPNFNLSTAIIALK